MKSICLTLTLFTTCAALPMAGLRAQSPSPAASATPSVSAPVGEAGEDSEESMDGKTRGRLATLSMDEKMKLRAAHKAAMHDPAVQAAKANRSTDKRGYKQAVQAAMIKADPSVEPILEKLKEEHHGKKA